MVLEGYLMRNFVCHFRVFIVLTVLLSGAFLLNIPNARAVEQSLAVTHSGYDNMGAILTRHGLKFKEIDEADLKNLDKLKSYDVIYINCTNTVDEGIVAAKDAEAIKNFVSGGGIVYASDFGASVIEAAFPEKIDFYDIGEGFEENEALGARQGDAGEVDATVTDSGLAAVLGKKSININFDLGGWVVVKSVGPGVRVHMRGPAAFSFRENEDKNNASEGDLPYVVSFSEGKGEVLFTSFHNEAQNTADMEKVLDWFATKTRVGKLAQDTRKIAVKDSGNKVLQEVVDMVDGGDEKSYEFKASGNADFGVILNFDGGSGLDISVTEPGGSVIVSEQVSKPPFVYQKIKAKKGTYVFKVKGEKTGGKNLPFVLSAFGPKKAAVDPIFDEDSVSVEDKWGSKQTLGVVFSVLIILGVIFYLKKFRKVDSKAKKLKR